MKCIPILMMMLQRVKFGKKCKFYGIPVIVKSKEGQITIGKGVRIRSGTLSNLIGLYQRTMIVTKGKGSIEIGDYVGMSGVTVYARDSIKIGEGCLIGANTKILDNDFHPLDAEERYQQIMSHPDDFAEFIPAREIIIGKNCFIGCNSIILKGTKLGDGCVVGAGAVVCGQFEGNCVIAGNPARVIKMLNVK